MQHSRPLQSPDHLSKARPTYAADEIQKNKLVKNVHIWPSFQEPRYVEYDHGEQSKGTW